MASDTKNVKLGACVVYYATDAENTSFVDLGYTKGGVEVTVETETHEVTVDQFGETKIAETITSRNITVSVPMAETTMDNLLTVMPGADWDDSSAKNCVVVNTGVNTNLLEKARCLILRPRDKAVLAKGAEGKYSEDLIVYKAGTPGGINFTYSADEERIFSVEFSGYPSQDAATGTDVPLFSFGNNTTLSALTEEAGS